MFAEVPTCIYIVSRNFGSTFLKLRKTCYLKKIETILEKKKHCLDCLCNVMWNILEKVPVIFLST